MTGVCVCVCVSDRQRRVCVPSDERYTQETHRLHVVRRRRVGMIGLSVCLSRLTHDCVHPLVSGRLSELHASYTQTHRSS